MASFIPIELSGIACQRVYTPDIILDNVLIEFERGRISMMGDFASWQIPPDYFNAREEGYVTVPGLIDVHVHGCGGADFLDNAERSIETISEVAARGGATSLVATTTIPTDDEQLEQFAERVRLLRETRPNGARMIGIHLEGPFLNLEKRGGFGPRFVQPIDLKKAEKILALCADALLKITLAPEIKNAESLVRLLLENPKTNVEISLGHTNADADLARKFFENSRVRQVTHAFNAMHPFHHREPNLIGAALTDDRVSMEMIPDGHHLTGPAINLLYRAKGPRRLMIITDGTAATATREGTRVESVGGWTEVRDGAVRLLNGALAGSNLLMSGALQQAQQLGNVPFDHAVQMCTRTPAESIHAQGLIGTIEPGKRADFCVLKADGSVAATIREGMLVYSAES